MTSRRGSATVEGVEEAGSSARRRWMTMDGIGLGLLAAAIGWTLMVAGGLSDGAWPVVALYAGSAIAYLFGRAVGPVIPAFVPAVVVAASLWAGWLSVTDWLQDGRMDRPFGYPNAQAGFYVLAVVASLMFASVSRRPVSRGVGLALAAGFGSIVLISGSVTAIILLALPTMALAARAGGLSRWFVAAGAMLLTLVLIGAVVLGLRYSPGSSAGLNGLSSPLTERRVSLWSDALDFIEERPLIGVGPGRFGIKSPTAKSDRDAGWAHNDFLQMGAETGVVGLVLLLGIFLWGIMRLIAGSAETPTAPLAAAALAGLGIQASVDYVLRFPGLPLAAAAIAGGAVALVSVSEADPGKASA